MLYTQKQLVGVFHKKEKQILYGDISVALDPDNGVMILDENGNVVHKLFGPEIFDFYDQTYSVEKYANVLVRYPYKEGPAKEKTSVPKVSLWQWVKKLLSKKVL